MLLLSLVAWCRYYQQHKGDHAVSPPFEVEVMESALMVATGEKLLRGGSRQLLYEAEAVMVSVVGWRCALILRCAMLQPRQWARSTA